METAKTSTWVLERGVLHFRLVGEREAKARKDPLRRRGAVHFANFPFRLRHRTGALHGDPWTLPRRVHPDERVGAGVGIVCVPTFSAVTTCCCVVVVVAKCGRLG